jgi:hypothetical protein
MEQRAVTVEADPDPAGEALPGRFRLGGRTIEVAEVLDRWPGADHLYVKVRGSDGATYILRQGLNHGGWRLVQFLAADAIGAADDDEDEGPRRIGVGLAPCVIRVVRRVRTATGSMASR